MLRQSASVSVARIALICVSIKLFHEIFILIQQELMIVLHGYCYLLIESKLQMKDLG